MWCSPHSSVDKESSCDAGNPGSISGTGRSAGEGIGYPLQYSGPENSMDCIVHGLATSWTQLSDFHFHVWMWELDHEEGSVPKNWCFQVVVLEKTLESFLDCKEIKLVNLKGNQPWTFIGRTDAETEVPILWPHDAKSRLIGKDLMLGKIEGKRRWGWQRLR